MEHLCKGKHFAQPSSKEKEKLPENRALIKLSEAHTQSAEMRNWLLVSLPIFLETFPTFVMQINTHIS